MARKSKKSKFLPSGVSGALKSLWGRIFGGAVMLCGVWALFAVCMYDPYLDGFAVASNFGTQSVMGNIVGALRYAVGVVPAFFVLLALTRWGALKMFGMNIDSSPEYNFLRGFITVCMGAIGFGLLVPSGNYGGMFGAIVSTDIGGVLGKFSPVLGVLCVGLFIVMAGVLLHISFAHLRWAFGVLVRWVRWIASAFHLIKPAQGEYEDDEEYEEDEDTEETEDEPEEKPKRTLIRKRTPKADENKVVATVAAVRPRRATAMYKLPDPKLLEKSVFGKNIITPELKRNATAMEVHFAEYGVNGKVVGIRPGPIVTLYEFMPNSGTRMADVSNTVRDMTRAMATENIRIAHIPSTQLIGVEMVNLKPQTVRYQTLVANETFINSKYKIPLALGVNIGGNPLYYDLAKMPHMLIAGRTGSGKSVFVQSIITSIVYHFTPDKCKLMIIDPKGVDFGFWDDIPHLITPIVKLDPAAAVNALKWAVREMEERYKQLQLLNARNVESYNEIAAEKRASGEKVTKQVAVGTDPETGELLFETQEVDLSDIPYIVIIIDEVADLMSLARKEVEACVQRIAQKARAAGIHLVMATQRPDATTITGVIKANFPTRVSFQARSHIDSMTTLGEKGAENLLACGDMLFSEAGRVPVRIHGAFISDEELNRIGKFLRAQGEPEYASGVTESEEDNAPVTPSKADIKAGKDTDLYEQAKEIVLRDKKTSISYLQRRLQIGYNKAAGLIERMEQEGVISGPDANNKRQIL